MSVTALLPMKGHSERVPNKNLRKFNGKPLYHHIMTTLHNVKLITEIIVNTDGDRIVDDIQTHFPDVRIAIRPEDICGDMVSMNMIIAHDLTIATNPVIVQTHATNPLLTASTLNQALDEFIYTTHSFDSMFSVTPIQTRLYDADLKPVNHNPDELRRTQDLPIYYEENSNFYIFTPESFHGNRDRRIGNAPGIFSMNPLEAMDIDTETDFKLAEMIQKMEQANES